MKAPFRCDTLKLTKAESNRQAEAEYENFRQSVADEKVQNQTASKYLLCGVKPEELAILQ